MIYQGFEIILKENLCKNLSKWIFLFSLIIGLFHIISKTKKKVLKIETIIIRSKDSTKNMNAILIKMNNAME